MSAEAPCKGCTERRRCCWSECEKYQEFAKARERQRETIANERRLDDYIFKRNMAQAKLNARLRQKNIRRKGDK